MMINGMASNLRSQAIMIELNMWLVFSAPNKHQLG